MVHNMFFQKKSYIFLINTVIKDEQLNSNRHQEYIIERN